jgi:hypothetical protein
MYTVLLSRHHNSYTGISSTEYYIMAKVFYVLWFYVHV